MEFKLVQHQKRPTERQLVKEIKRVAALFKSETLSSTQYRKHGTIKIGWYTKHFGGWNKALEYAGLKIGHMNNIPMPLLFDNLKEVWLQLERQPSAHDMRRPLSRFGYEPYQRAFGTWSKALHHFVDYIAYEKETGKTSADYEKTIKKPVQLHKTKRKVQMKLRHLVLQRDNYRCCACGASPANQPGVLLQIDHIVAWVKGGETTMDNLQVLCSVCNTGKGAL